MIMTIKQTIVFKQHITMLISSVQTSSTNLCSQMTGHMIRSPDSYIRALAAPALWSVTKTLPSAPSAKPRQNAVLGAVFQRGQRLPGGTGEGIQGRYPLSGRLFEPRPVRDPWRWATGRTDRHQLTLPLAGIHVICWSKSRSTLPYRCV